MRLCAQHAEHALAEEWGHLVSGITNEEHPPIAVGPAEHSWSAKEMRRSRRRHVGSTQ